MKTTKTFLPLLFPVLALACGSAPASTPTVPVSDTGVSQTAVEPSAPTPSPTKAVPPDLAVLVATLVETGEVTSKGVGYAGEKSASYAAYEQVAAAASVDELRDLLSHESPIVRAYVGAHLGRNDAASLSQLAEVLTDATAIEAQYGCMGVRATVASHVANELCYVRNYVEHGPEAERLLRAAAQDPSSPAYRDATHCLSRPVPTKP